MGEEKHGSAFVCLWKLMEQKSCIANQTARCGCLSGRRAKRQVPSWSSDMRRDLMGESVKARLFGKQAN